MREVSDTSAKMEWNGRISYTTSSHYTHDNWRTSLLCDVHMEYVDRDVQGSTHQAFFNAVGWDWQWLILGSRSNGIRITRHGA